MILVSINYVKKKTYKKDLFFWDMIKDYTGSDESISSRIPMLLFGSVHDNCCCWYYFYINFCLFVTIYFILKGFLVHEDIFQKNYYYCIFFLIYKWDDYIILIFHFYNLLWLDRSLVVYSLQMDHIWLLVLLLEFPQLVTIQVGFLNLQQL